MRPRRTFWRSATRGSGIRYDYSIPDGRGVFGGNGWLKPALDDAKVPPALQEQCVQVLIDYAASNLERLRASAPDRIRVVDSRGTLLPEDWANELHPLPEGFEKIASQCWRPMLADDGLA